MRIFQTLWTKPALDNRWDIGNQLKNNLWIYALSATYAKQLGITLVMHTDSLGAELLKDFPYDEIYTTLDNIPNDLPSMVWAYGKFKALEQEPLGSIHIDGDVFLKNPEIKNLLNFSNYDLIVQNKEPITAFNYVQMETFMKECNWFDTNIFSLDYALNCGLIGINNLKLKQTYLNYYFNAINNALSISRLRERIENDKCYCIDLPIEQHSLAKLSNGYNVKCLLKNGNEEMHGDATKQKAYEIGYHHLIGREKYRFIDKIKFTVFILNKQLHDNLEKTINEYQDILS